MINSAPFKNTNPWNDKEILQELIEKGFSTRKIAQHFKCSQSTIRYHLNKFKLSTTYVSESKSKKSCIIHGAEHMTYYSDGGGKKRIACKKCSVIKVGKRKKLMKQFALQYLGGQCVSCRYQNYAGSLHIHHLDPKNKKFSLSDVLHYKNHLEITAELDKCSILCANCHFSEHSTLGEGKYYDRAHRTAHTRKISLFQVLGGKCFICKNTQSKCLTFHHLNPNFKKFNLTTSGGLKNSLQIVWEEAVKCVLLCANCHAETEAGMHEQKQEEWLTNMPHNTCDFEEWLKMIKSFQSIKTLKSNVQNALKE